MKLNICMICQYSSKINNSYENFFNLNIYCCCVFLVSTILLNQYTWLLVFGAEELYLWKKVIFGLLDLFFIFSSIVIFINRNKKITLFITLN